MFKRLNLLRILRERKILFLLYRIQEKTKTVQILFARNNIQYNQIERRRKLKIDIFEYYFLKEKLR